jgi:hypothetical protein
MNLFGAQVKAHELVSDTQSNAIIQVVKPYKSLHVNVCTYVCSSRILIQSNSLFDRK